MRMIIKSAIVAITLLFMFMADVPFLFEYLVPEAQAVLGVRRRTARRTAVIVGSEASQQQAAADQQAATAQQQSATAQQQSATAQQQAAAQPAQTVPIGTVVPQLPAGCAAVVVSGVSYSDCGGAFYKTAFQGNNLIYVVVAKPMP
jgi:hypothetical protein